ncbi:histone-lysine N-methyltransferase MECOM [Scaptodrosophila lebanonensis]|uniref:Histone-lysine N-methyltransferase MECOM n=1 Tax=Drosophila lebanonensis TaxID=7225 RepID=A0A6J2U3Z3_DROLE|nr:histone-lysine N-methyltransferase MECOM [Scaptodrosophila lebanonensis]XP_030382631.1 histone-lysine N-methyltransferase MECOM [Scaptodrosophila lebanonensis]
MQAILPKTPGTKNQRKSVKSASAGSAPRIYHCPICFAGFVRFSTCRSHTLECEPTNELLYVCKYCLTLYGDEEVLQRHILRLHSDRRFLCLQCGSEGKRYAASGFLYKHINSWHGGHSLFYCALCADDCNDARTFSSHAALIAHAAGEHQLYASATRSDADTDSVADADETEDLEMLEENIDELLPPVDWDDDVQFGWPTGLSKEDCIADPRPPAYVCPVCGNGFPGSLSLLNHIDKDHKSRNPLHCIYCGKEHETREAVRSHLQRQHVLVRPHICKTCNRDFATADHLHKHAQSQHQTQLPFVCPATTCNKAFAQLGHLKRHMETDRHHKTYICALCDDQFFRRIDLERHVIRKHP